MECHRAGTRREPIPLRQGQALQEAWAADGRPADGRPADGRPAFCLAQSQTLWHSIRRLSATFERKAMHCPNRSPRNDPLVPTFLCASLQLGLQLGLDLGL
jgi:hypothetical protein